MVNRERVALLVAALRSGEFQQVEGTLGHENKSGEAGYCCLGVACVVASRNGVDMIREVGSRGFIRFDGETAVLSPKVRDWYGFQHVNPWLPANDEHVEATVLNDDMAWNFDQIADAFERLITKEEGKDA